ncbi:MAG: acetyltransferase [Steroidobacteraceae bacterium]
MTNEQASEHQDMEGWAILELFGHRKLAGDVTVVQIGGTAFFRIDVPAAGTHPTTQFYSPAAVYALTPTTEEIARGYAERVQPRPVERWELPRLAGATAAPDNEEDNQPFNDDDRK